MKAVSNTLNVKLPEGKERSTTATLNYALSSYKKMELVAKMVRGKEVAYALNLLSFTPKRSAKILYKVVLSALANAKNNAKLDESGLVIKRVDIGKGPKIKRMRFVARSRVHSYQKYRSFVRVVLDNK